ncbi:hypothetical protein V3C99_018803 [Haemonchus contortus]|uniref:Transporter n=1 Tax=Haemonchus contortus TaxID=6289 RepID=A0A7I4YZK5_HAECO
MSIRSCSSTISSTFTSLLGNMNSTAMVMVMFSIAILAILPGVKILLFFTDLYPDLPPQSSFIQHLHYLLMAIIIPVLGVAGVMVYADIAFPLVTYIFAIILNLSSQNNLRIRIKRNTASTK